MAPGRLWVVGLREASETWCAWRDVGSAFSYFCLCLESVGQCHLRPSAPLTAQGRPDRLLVTYPNHLSLVWPPVLPHRLAMASCQLSYGDLSCGVTQTKAGYHLANTCSHTDRPSSSSDGHWDFCSAKGWRLLCVQLPSARLSLSSDAAACIKPSRVWSAQMSACLSTVLSDYINPHHAICCPLH